MSQRKVKFTIITLKWLCECNEYLIQFTNKTHIHTGSRGITVSELKKLKKHLHIKSTNKVEGSSFKATEEAYTKQFALLIQ